MNDRDDNRKNYIEAKKRIEADANYYTVVGLLCTCGVLMVCWVLTYVGYFQVDLRSMSITSIVCMMLLALVALMSRVIPAGLSWFKYLNLTTICIAMGVLSAVLSYHVSIIMILPLIFATQYSSKKTLWITYGINLVCNTLALMASHRIGIIDLNLYFSGLYTTKELEELLASGALPVNPDRDLVVLLYAAVPRAIMMGLMTVLISILTTRGRRAAVSLSRFKNLSETDYMTGLGNKAKYKEMLEKHYPDIDNVSVIYFDLNNLKEINDEYGHSRGDALITAFSEVLLSRCDESTHAFRLGGDEFLLVMEYREHGSGKKIADEISAELRNKLVNDAENIYGDAKEAVAVGVAEGRGDQMKDLVESADINMYVDKRKKKATHKESES